LVTRKDVPILFTFCLIFISVQQKPQNRLRGTKGNVCFEQLILNQDFSRALKIYKVLCLKFCTTKNILSKTEKKIEKSLHIWIPAWPGRPVKIIIVWTCFSQILS